MLKTTTNQLKQNNMKRVVKYHSRDREYSDVTQVYIGANELEIDRIQEETEEFMWQHNPAGYKTEVVEEDEGSTSECIFG